jgi:DNA-binding transcriptional LysR family regulator
MDLTVANVNLNFLQTFVLVAETGSFRVAADQLHRSQSAISTQIRMLEEQFGLTLFHRTTRHVQLTPDGDALLASARRALHELSSALRHISESADIRRGRIAIACSPTVAATLLPPTLSTFEEAFPQVRIELRELPSNELFEAIREGEVDFGIGPVLQDSNFQFDVLIAEPLYALVPRRYRNGQRKTITLKELSELPLLLSTGSTAMRKLLETEFEKHHLQLNTKYQCTQAQTLVALSEAGLGVAILPESVLRTLMRTDSVALLKVVEPEMARQVAIITLKGQGLSPAAGRRAQMIREQHANPSTRRKARPHTTPH